MKAIHFKFYVTNNDAEYEALINGLKLALEVGVVNLIVQSDYELVVNQVNGGFQARGPRMELYMRCVQRLLERFGNARLESVPREENSNADALAKMGSQMDSVQLGQIPLGIQEIPRAVPEDKLQARRLRYQDAKYVEYDGRGARRDLWQSLGGGSLAFKVLKQGYYWPTMKKDVFNFVRACDRCQRFANYSNDLASTITSLANPWPFAMWRNRSHWRVSQNKGESRVPRRDLFVEEDAEVNQGLHLDLLDEARTNSQLKLAAYQQRIARYFNKKVKSVPFKVGDLVLRKVMPNTKIAQHGVLGANWEGPYKVKAILWKGTYRLKDLDGKPIPRAWNAEHLRKYYQ
ncbi:uncharacterized protein LOC141697496 [Apium graveolens]|uniref:uncharacterized protein LOC141697496 n=1 Tax=Apium graveolens TaxID=4045 RepID=UPI003D7BDEC9